MRWELAVREWAELGEGPTWDAASARLIWVDILSARIHTYDPADGRRTVLATEQHVGAAKPRAGGGLVVNIRDGVALYGPEDPEGSGRQEGPGGGFRWLLREPVAGRRANDAAVAPDGSLWAGTMRYDEAPGGGTLTRIAPDGTATRVLGGVSVSNGIGWSPDGRLMYYIDSPTRTVDVFDFDGQLAHNRRKFVSLDPEAGFPDGLNVDAEGGVWVALWDGAAVRRYAADGTLDQIVELPVRRPTACAFGGPGLTDLYITSARVGQAAPHPLAGSVLVVPGAGHGVPGNAFAG